MNGSSTAPSLSSICVSLFVTVAGGIASGIVLFIIQYHSPYFERAKKPESGATHPKLDARSLPESGGKSVIGTQEKVDQPVGRKALSIRFQQDLDYIGSHTFLFPCIIVLCSLLSAIVGYFRVWNDNKAQERIKDVDEVQHLMGEAKSAAIDSLFGGLQGILNSISTISFFFIVYLIVNGIRSSL